MLVVLRHELAHVRRHDWIVQLLAEAARAVCWFNPLMWLACARLRREGEQACDDIVLAGGVEAPAYATHLLDLAPALPGRAGRRGPRRSRWPDLQRSNGESLPC